MIKLELDEDRLKEWKADLAESKRQSAEKRMNAGNSTQNSTKCTENRTIAENRKDSPDVNDLAALFDDENRN
ncbi:hypothetical protein NBRC116494_21320 [Aurantivibrio plasticivorans]